MSEIKQTKKQEEPNNLLILLNFILPGLGSIILRREAGIPILILYFVSFPLIFIIFPIGFCLLLGSIIWDIEEIVKVLQVKK